MGLSPDHASTVPLVFNLDTSAITPQFHVVFDGWFTTVTTSIDDLPDFNSTTWAKMFGDSEYQFIRDEDDSQVDSEDSMTSEAITTRQNRVSKAMDTTMPPTPLPVSPPPSSPSTPSHHPSPVPSSSCLPALLTLLYHPHQLVPHLQLSTRGRNHTWLSPSNRGSPQDLKTPIHPSHLNRGSHLYQLFEDPTGHVSKDPC